MADEAGDTLFIYARCRKDVPVGKLTSVSLDGVPLSDVTLYGEPFPAGVALAVAKLPQALKIGDFSHGKCRNGQRYLERSAVSCLAIFLHAILLELGSPLA